MSSTASISMKLSEYKPNRESKRGYECEYFCKCEVMQECEYEIVC